MKTFSFKYLSISILTLLLGVSANAQNVYQLYEENSKLSVKGTASKHDWEMDAPKFRAETGIKLEGNIVSEIQFVEFTISSDQHFKVSGKVNLKMSDFGIDPPTDFLGLIKVDDEVEVVFNLEFEKVD